MKRALPGAAAVILALHLISLHALAAWDPLQHAMRGGASAAAALGALVTFFVVRGLAYVVVPPVLAVCLIRGLLRARRRASP
jgi:hypothetical protein